MAAFIAKCALDASYQSLFPVELMSIITLSCVQVIRVNTSPSVMLQHDPP